MTEQLSIFDNAPTTTAEDAKREAIARVWDAAREWQSDALEAIWVVAKRYPILTTDDLWAIGLKRPREPRAMGGAMKAAAREGWIEPTDRTRKSKRSACHARPIRIWRSLIHEG
jgi:hypothetical protein